jgi:hypothetical protein
MRQRRGLQLGAWDSVPGFVNPEIASAEGAIHFRQHRIVSRAFSACLLLPIEFLGRCPRLELT